MINRNNYEEYFLLLADNELSAEEVDAVKQFAAQHPDLAEEMELLLSCRFNVEPPPVFPKEKLLRPVMWNAENTEPVQTQMLLLLDGELNPAEQEQLHQQIAASIALQAEWRTLQQAKLPVETIAHPDKETLRRSTEKVRPLLWRRWVAAAAVVAGLGWLFSLQQEPKTTNTLAAAIEQEQKIIAPAADTEPQSSVRENKRLEADVAVTAASALQSKPVRQVSNPSQENHLRSPVNENKPEPANTYAANIATDAEPVTDRRVRDAGTDLSIDAVEPEPVMQVAHLKPTATKLPVLTSSHKEESFTGSKPAVLTEDENDYVTIGAAHVNKQKMRGLFRNVTRTVARGFSKSKMEPDVYATR